MKSDVSDVVALLESHDQLKQQNDWFKRQLFGEKSERRLLLEPVDQLTLGEQLRPDPTAPDPTLVVDTHKRRRNGKKRSDDWVLDSGLRFDNSVPVEVIEVWNPEAEQWEEGSYSIVGEKHSYHLAQKPAAYVIVDFVRKALKHKESGVFSCPPAPGVLEKSNVDVSFLANMMIDKLVYHLPLYRQHQRLRAAGVALNRSTLTVLCQRSAELLRPIFDALLLSIVSSEVLTMDETPIKAGRKGKGKMSKGYFWPVYGDKAEIAYPFAPTRAKRVIEEVLGQFCGTLLTDGYEAYASYAKEVNRAQRKLIHAQCWVHTRRGFEKAQEAEPQLCAAALSRIGELYRIEAEIRDKNLEDEKKKLHRSEHSRSVVDAFFNELESSMQEHLLLPSSPYTKAAAYALDREKSLRVFLEYPNVPIDTNHLEREIRPIALGRKNWMFCWTELGAEHIGIVQSLLGSCRLQGVDPYIYLVDVLQRVATHPAKDVQQLTPRLWKERFADNPLRSVIDRERVRGPG